MHVTVSMGQCIGDYAYVELAYAGYTASAVTALICRVSWVT